MKPVRKASPLTSRQRRNRRRSTILCAGFLVPFIVASVLNPERSGLGLLAIAYFLLLLCLSGPFFLALEQVTGATWSFSIQEILRKLARLLPFPSLALLAVVLLFSDLHYPMDSEGSGSAFREVWQNHTFLLLRTVIYLALWIGFSRLLLRSSTDHGGGTGRQEANTPVRGSTLFLVILGLTFWLSTQDWILSLTPHWYSTIFAIYNFAGFFLAGLAMIILLSLRRSAKSIATAARLSVTSLFQLGRLLFAISCLWAYLWFTQYMLIWYAHIPRETSYFISRVNTGWAPLFYLSLTLNWLVPFLALMPRRSKASQPTLGLVAAAVLTGRWIEVCLMVFPDHLPLAPWFALPESLLAILFFGILFLDWIRSSLWLAGPQAIGDSRGSAPSSTSPEEA